jgi:hypothetical protein
MNRYSRFIQAVLGLTAWAGAGLAEGGVILPVNDAGAPIPNAPVSVSLFDAFGQDITDTWLPTWEPPDGKAPIYVRFNHLGVPVTPLTVGLVPPPVTPVSFNGLENPFLALPRTTSAYPGRCTNYSGSPTVLSADFTLTTTPDGLALKSEDCGGIAVIEASVPGVAGPHRFVIPRDSNNNGIPDIWEATYCPSTSPCPSGLEDDDAGPIAGAPTGDAISAFDEYRGFIVSGVHVSTDPRRRDLFVRLVNPQCGATSLLGGATPAYPNDGTGLFDNLTSLVPGSNVHLLGYTTPVSGPTEEWVDRFVSFSQQTGFQYQEGPNAPPTSIAPVDDRRINQNAVFPLGIANPVAGGGLIQKGLRITECLDVSATSPLGSTGLGSPTGPDNSLVYTQRIADYIDTLIAAGGARTLKLFGFENGAWVSKTNSNGTVNREFIISQAMKFYVAHELSHSTRLTPTVEGTNKTSYGYHHAPLTGSVMDQTIVHKIDRSTSGFSSFYIPSLYNGSDQSSYKIRD